MNSYTNYNSFKYHDHCSTCYVNVCTSTLASTDLKHTFLSPKCTIYKKRAMYNQDQGLEALGFD
jgi:hypothetical protein